MATTIKGAFSTESNILPSNMIGNTILVAVPGYRNVVHITTQIIDGQVQPAHYAVKSAFMPYDKDYRANYRSMLATKLLSRGDHNEASVENQNEAPIKLGNEATNGTNNEKYDSAKQRKDKVEQDETDKEVERYNGYYFNPIDPCQYTQFRGYGEYTCLNQVCKPTPQRYHCSKDDEISSYNDPRLYDDGSDVSGRSTWESGESIVFHVDPTNRKISNGHGNAYPHVSGRSSWERGDSIVFYEDPSKKIKHDGHGESKVYTSETESVSAKSYNLTELQKTVQCGTDGQKNDRVRDGERSLSYFNDGVLEDDTVDIDYDYYFVDEWGCVSGRNDESCFWKY